MRVSKYEQDSGKEFHWKWTGYRCPVPLGTFEKKLQLFNKAANNLKLGMLLNSLLFDFPREAYDLMVLK